MISKSVEANKINLSNVQFFLLCTIPYSLVFSIFVADFFLVLICFLFIIKNIKEKKNYFNNNFFKFFFIFWIYISVRSLFAEDIFFSLKSSLLFIRVGIFAVAVKFLIEENPKRIYVLFIILASFLPIVAADGLLQFFTGKNIFGYYVKPGRLSGFFNTELIFGSYIARMTPVMIGIYFYCKYLKLISQKKSDFYFLIIIIFLFFLVLLSGERVANAYFFIIIFFSFLFFKITISKKIVTFFFVILLTIFIFFRSEVVSQRLIFFTLDQMQSNTYQAQMKSNTDQTEVSKYFPTYIFSVDHHNHILAAYEIFKENIFFGSGVKMFRIICDQRYKVNKHSCSTHPHNLIMQFLAETGIIGLFFYFLSLFYILIKIFKIIIGVMYYSINNNDKAKFFFLIALFIGLFPIIPSGNFFNNWISIISFLPVGLYISKIKKTF